MSHISQLFFSLFFKGVKGMGGGIHLSLRKYLFVEHLLCAKHFHVLYSLSDIIHTAILSRVLGDVNQQAKCHTAGKLQSWHSD